MSLRDLSYKPTYKSFEDNLLEDFYLPVLNESVQYDRNAGFFSSASLALTARGIYGFLGNKGKIRIIACHKLSESDIHVIDDVSKNPEKYLSGHLLDELDKFEDEFQKDHVRALGWMLANSYLELKIAIIYDLENREAIEDALFHDKAGILTDQDGNQIAYSGSINETAKAWMINYESFNVFESWVENLNQFVDGQKEKFNSLWNGEVPGIRIYEAPEAIRKKLTEIGNKFDREKIALHKYREKQNPENNIFLFPHQQQALDLWINNNHKLLFSMATGTGKTRTGIACIAKVKKEFKKFICIVACPETTLSLQWKNEIENNICLKFDRKIIADGTNPSWKSDLIKLLGYISSGIANSGIIYTTHNTASSLAFLQIINDNSRDIKICFVGDEAHHLGAPNFQKALLDRYEFRIGLSATPDRNFDEIGSQALREYFGNNIFEFTIWDALTKFNKDTYQAYLTDFYYHIVPVSLTVDEAEMYKRLSEQLLYCHSKLARNPNDEETKNKLERLQNKRAKIIKNAENKISKFNELLSQLKRQYGQIKKTLIFVDSQNQIDSVIKIAYEHILSVHEITEKTGACSSKKYGGKSERQDVIDKFKNDSYQALVSINCMDEGIDIPDASMAIIMASSTNPRQFTQRIGRVIRKSKGKSIAQIYDFIVIPDFRMAKYNQEFYEYEKEIFDKECERIRKISTNALNRYEVYKDIDQIKTNIDSYN